MKIYLRKYKQGSERVEHEVVVDAERVSVWISDELMKVHSDELENLLNVVVWFSDGKTKTYKSVIDCEVF